MPRPRKQHQPGRIETHDRPFDAAADVAPLKHLRDLPTGAWGLLRFAPPADAGEPAAAYLRISDKVLTTGDRIPLHDQLDQILQMMRLRGQPAALVAVYWDCQTGTSYTSDGSGHSVRVTRPAYEQCLEDGIAGQYQHLWVWRSDRAYRGLRPAAQLQEACHAGVRLHSATDELNERYLGFYATMKEEERNSIVARTRSGRERRVRENGLPPTGHTPSGWRQVRNPSGAAPAFRLEHDPAAMPAWEFALTGLRFEGWGYADAAAHLVAAGVPRQAADHPWTAHGVRLCLGNHTWWIGEGTAAFQGVLPDGTRSPRAQDRARVSFPVPPARMRDPETGWRVLTADDLAAIRALAPRQPVRARHPDAHRPLTGLVRCRECDWALQPLRRTSTAVTKRRTDGTVVRRRYRLSQPQYLYRCHPPSHRRAVGQEPCTRRPLALSEAWLLEAAWAQLVAHLATPDLFTARYREVVAAQAATPEVVEYETQEDRLQALALQEVRWRDDYHAGEVSEAAYRLKMAVLREEREYLTQALARLRERYETLQRARRELEDLRALTADFDFARVGAHLAAVPASERPALLCHLLETLWVGPAKTLTLALKWVGLADLAHLARTGEACDASGFRYSNRKRLRRHAVLL